MFRFLREPQSCERYTQKTKANITITFSTIPGSIKTVIFIDQDSAKKKKLLSFTEDLNVFGRCLQKLSTNPQITPDLLIFTEKMLTGKPQNLQNFPL